MPTVYVVCAREKSAEVMMTLVAGVYSSEKKAKRAVEAAKEGTGGAVEFLVFERKLDKVYDKDRKEVVGAL